MPAAFLCTNCGVERAFRVHVRHECNQGTQRLRPLILDIGCNDGNWGLKLLERIAADGRCAREVTRLVLLEPQPDLASRLRQRTVNTTGVDVIQAAAWIADNQTLSLHVPLSVSSRQERWASRTASLTREMALHQVGTTRNVSVLTVDLARFLTSELAGESRWPVLLKLDIETSEYDVLPKLLVAGLLCRIHYLLVEWHLNALTPQRRLAGLALRLALNQTLQACKAPPLLLQFDEHAGNNFEAQVPGLWDVAVMHNGTAAAGRASRNAGSMRWDLLHDPSTRAARRRQQQEEAAIDELRRACGGVWVPGQGCLS